MIFILRLLSDDDDEDPASVRTVVAVAVAVGAVSGAAAVGAVVPDGLGDGVAEMCDIVLSMSASRPMIKFPRSTSGLKSKTIESKLWLGGSTDTIVFAVFTDQIYFLRGKVRHFVSRKVLYQANGIILSEENTMKRRILNLA